MYPDLRFTHPLQPAFGAAGSCVTSQQSKSVDSKDIERLFDILARREASGKAGSEPRGPQQSADGPNNSLSRAAAFGARIRTGMDPLMPSKNQNAEQFARGDKIDGNPAEAG